MIEESMNRLIERAARVSQQIDEDIEHAKRVDKEQLEAFKTMSEQFISTLFTVRNRMKDEGLITEEKQFPIYHQITNQLGALQFCYLLCHDSIVFVCDYGSRGSNTFPLLRVKDDNTFELIDNSKLPDGGASRYILLSSALIESNNAERTIDVLASDIAEMVQNVNSMQQTDTAKRSGLIGVDGQKL